MAGLRDPSMEMMLELQKQGWEVVDMQAYEPNITNISHWCRENLGDMRIHPNIGLGRWFGAVFKLSDRSVCYFAFRDPADYTMLQLRWA